MQQLDLQGYLSMWLQDSLTHALITHFEHLPEWGSFYLGVCSMKTLHWRANESCGKICGSLTCTNSSNLHKRPFIWSCPSATAYLRSNIRTQCLYSIIPYLARQKVLNFSSKPLWSSSLMIFLVRRAVHASYRVSPQLVVSKEREATWQTCSTRYSSLLIRLQSNSNRANKLLLA